MTVTPNLIDALVAAAVPVRRARHPLSRAGLWLLLAASVIGVLVLLHGPRFDLAARLRQPVFCAGIAASLLTGALAAVAAFLASLPDRSRLWLLLPLPAALLWVGSIGFGCLTDWVVFDPAGFQFGEAARCFGTLLLSGIPLSVAMFWMLRHAARLRPTGPVLAGALAVAALTATALSLLHPFEASLMVLLWNLGAALLVLLVDAAVGRRAMRRFQAATS